MSRSNNIKTGGEGQMLILTRRCGESIQVGENVTFTVLGISGKNVRVGISAPREISVDREEVYERKRREAQSRPPEYPDSSERMAVRARR
jgi:carbon storage regulator